MPPAYYHEVPWTERGVIREEKHIPGSKMTEFDTLVDNTVKVYLVWAEHPADVTHAYDRRLDFTKPVVSLDTDGGCAVVAVRGAAEAVASNKDGVLVIRDGELTVKDVEELLSLIHI